MVAMDPWQVIQEGDPPVRTEAMHPHGGKDKNKESWWPGYIILHVLGTDDENW